MERRKPYWVFRWWLRWLVPLPILLKITRRMFGDVEVVWYQGDDLQLESRPRKWV